MITWFRYARHADVPAFEAAGWRVCGELGMPHAFYSVLMEWCGAGEPAGAGA